MQRLNSKVKSLSVIPASRSEAKAQAIQQNRAWPGIQGYTPDSINSTLDSCFRRNDKQALNCNFEF